MVQIGNQYKKIHFIGIGGIHMSGLAEMCKLFGCTVSGSDAAASDTTERLASKGIPVIIGHKPENIDKNTELIVYTSAVKPENPEMVRARELNIKVMDKAGLLGLVMTKYVNNICVAGSHGKTTTTAMIAETLWGLFLNPTIMNGGTCTRIGASMLLGGDEYFVCEADEYYDAFLKMKPKIGVILNIEHDHTDYFPTEKSLTESFKRFANLIDTDGVLVIYGGIRDLNYLTDGLKCRVVTYGSHGADFEIAGFGRGAGGFPLFRVLYNGKDMGDVSLSVPGEHNAQNALAAIAVCHSLGLSFGDITEQLAQFTGAARRFQYRGELNGAKIYDDYAHNPTEIRAILKAAKDIHPGRVIAVIQPHTRSRTLEFFDDFGTCCADADKVILVDIFTPAGREEGHINISSADLRERLRENGADAVYCPSFGECESHLREIGTHGDMIIIMGAGDCTKIGVGLDIKKPEARY